MYGCILPGSPEGAVRVRASRLAGSSIEQSPLSRRCGCNPRAFLAETPSYMLGVPRANVVVTGSDVSQLQQGRGFGFDSHHWLLWSDRRSTVVMILYSPYRKGRRRMRGASHANRQAREYQQAGTVRVAAHGGGLWHLAA